jgi:sporulation protein YlmC with PRC-barrel domain
MVAIDSKGVPKMKRLALLLLSCVVLLVPGKQATAQVAGSSTLGVTVEELKAVAIGWSAKRQILGKAVYNDKNARVGRIDDIIITPERSVSFVIVGAGGFVGVARHDVAIPVGQLQEKDGKYILPGATKEAIKALPKFEYAKK